MCIGLVFIIKCIFRYVHLQEAWMRDMVDLDIWLRAILPSNIVYYYNTESIYSMDVAAIYLFNFEPYHG